MKSKSSRTRLFKFTDDWVARFWMAAHTIHAGIWLGLLDRPSLLELVTERYDVTGNYLNLEYNRSGFWYWETKSLDQYFSSCQSVLVGAAGGGRELLALARRGVRADGFECSPKLLDACRALLTAEKIQATVLSAAPDTVPKQFETYDGLILGWGAYTHMIGRENRIRFLSEFRKHLQPDGPLLLSFFIRKPGSRRFRWTFRIARLLQTLRRSKEPAELGDASPGLFHHHFIRKEIEQELAEAGFHLESYVEADSGYAVARSIGL